jgi:hypothetical protein
MKPSLRQQWEEERVLLSEQVSFIAVFTSKNCVEKC